MSSNICFSFLSLWLTQEKNKILGESELKLVAFIGFYFFDKSFFNINQSIDLFFVKDSQSYWYIKKQFPT